MSDGVDFGPTVGRGPWFGVRPTMRHYSLTIMSRLIVVDCEAPFGVGAPSVGDMTEFGAVDVDALREGRT